MNSKATLVGLSSIQQQIQISLYNVEQSAYPSLSLKDISYPYWIISHVLEGEVETGTQGETYIAKAGDVMIHPPNVIFSEISSKKGVHQWIGFDSFVAPHLDILRVHPISLVVRLSTPMVYSQLFSTLLGHWIDASSSVREFSASSYASVLISMVLESWRIGGSLPRTTLSATNQDRFHLLIHYITEYSESKLSRQELAKMVHLHPVYLDRVFTEYYGMPPMQMLREMRLRKAKKLLESTSETLSFIADSCGFNDAAYFSHQFAKQYGQTPGEYREHAKKIMQSYMQ